MERLNDLHIKVLKFEDQSDGDARENVNEFLNDVNTPAVIEDNVIENLRKSLSASGNHGPL